MHSKYTMGTFFEKYILDSSGLTVASKVRPNRDGMHYSWHRLRSIGLESGRKSVFIVFSFSDEEGVAEYKTTYSPLHYPGLIPFLQQYVNLDDFLKQRREYRAQTAKLTILIVLIVLILSIIPALSYI